MYYSTKHSNTNTNPITTVSLFMHNNYWSLLVDMCVKWKVFVITTHGMSLLMPV